MIKKSVNSSIIGLFFGFLLICSQYFNYISIQIAEAQPSIPQRYNTQWIAPGHTSVVNLAVLPDQNTLVSSGVDRTIKFWDITSGRSLFTLAGQHIDSIVGLEVSNNGTRLITGSKSRTINPVSNGVRLWSLTRLNGVLKAAEITNLRSQNSSLHNPVSLSFDSALFAYVETTPQGRNLVRIGDAVTGNIIRTIFDTTQLITSLRFSTMDRSIAVASNGVIIVYNADDGSTIRTLLHPGIIFAMSFSPNGQLLASRVQDGGIRVWQGTNQLSNFSTNLDTYYKMEFSPDNSSLLLGYGSQADIRTTSGALLERFAASAQSLYAAVFIASGTKVATASADGSIRIYNRGQTQMQKRLPYHWGSINGFAVAPGQDYIASGGGRASSYSDNSIRIWSPINGAQLAVLGDINDSTRHTIRVRDLSISPNGKLLASVSDDGNIKIWEMSDRVDSDGNSWELLQTVLSSHNGSTIGQGKFSSDGQYFITSGGNQTIRIWNVTTGSGGSWLTPGTTISNPHGSASVNQLKPRPGSSNQFTSVGGDFKVRFWSLPTGQEVTDLRISLEPTVPNALAFSPDGSRIVVGGEILSAQSALLSLYQINGNQIQFVRSYNGEQDIIRTLSFRGDGLVFGSGVSGPNIRLWSLDSSQPYFTFPEERNPLAYEQLGGIEFMSNNRIVIGRSDGTVVMSQFGPMPKDTTGMIPITPLSEF